MGKKILSTFVASFVIILVLVFTRSCADAKNATSTEQNIESLISAEQSGDNSDFEYTGNATRKTFNYETDVFNVVFDTKGASVSSLKFKNHANADGEFVDMVFNGDGDKNAFVTYWGDNLNKPVDDVFDYCIDGNSVIFSGSYRNAEGKTFRLVKTYEFRPSDYLIQVSVNVEGDGFDCGKYAYTMAYEPQVGPEFDTLTSGKGKAYGDYRRFYYGSVKKNGKVKRQSVTLGKDGVSLPFTKVPAWMSITSKYFTVIARPENQEFAYKYQAIQSKSADISQTDSIYISVPAESRNTTVYFYCGPQLKKYLKSYYSGTDNPWGLRNINLDDAMEPGSMFGWLETILKWALMLLNKIVPNYGIDIIILTVILKFVLWPLQKKSNESTAKMGTITPEINEIKAKYPNNTQKQNEEMQKLYKAKGINPMGGCLPLLIQFPILIAFYGLLNKHFELRGAMFIPGWIPDLSVPETIATLGFSIPLLGSQIHLLPIIYTASMIFSMKFTQSSNKNVSTGNSMWFMTWGMPIMFFFILYGAPSGLLLYWTTQNLLSIVQQKYTNDKIKKFGPDVFTKKKNDTVEKKEPKAVLKYQEKLKKLAERNDAKNTDKKD